MQADGIMCIGAAFLQRLILHSDLIVLISVGNVCWLLIFCFTVFFIYITSVFAFITFVRLLISLRKFFSLSALFSRFLKLTLSSSCLLISLRGHELCHMKTKKHC